MSNTRIGWEKGQKICSIHRHMLLLLIKFRMQRKIMWLILESEKLVGDLRNFFSALSCRRPCRHQHQSNSVPLILEMVPFDLTAKAERFHLIVTLTPTHKEKGWCLSNKEDLVQNVPTLGNPCILALAKRPTTNLANPFGSDLFLSFSKLDISLVM